jgi:hypothetical protein
VQRLSTQPPALLGQSRVDLALIRQIAVPFDAIEGFQALKQGSERIRLQRKPLPQFTDGLTVTLPKQDHHQVLWIGQVELLQQRLVDAIARVVRRIHFETKEFIERGSSGQRIAK